MPEFLFHEGQVSGTLTPQQIVKVVQVIIQEYHSLVRHSLKSIVFESIFPSLSSAQNRSE